jgi:ethanolamine ammonia-lyase large subunit
VLRGRHAKLRFSLYTDDAVIFINPIKQDVDMVVDIMKKFGDVTGLRINLQKKYSCSDSLSGLEFG